MNNLLKWPNLDSTELRILLHELIGGMGQSDDLGRARPRNFYLPLAGPSCRVVLKFDGKKVVAIEPGEAFDAVQWQQVSNEIEHSITGDAKVGRDYSFSGRRVNGSWRGKHSGVQILPPPAHAPSAPVDQADHPFILEFHLMASSVDELTNYRRLRKHRDLTLLLNVLLVGGAKSMGLRPPSFWAYEAADLSQKSKWVQQGFSVPLGDCLIDQLSVPATPQLKELPPEVYDSMSGNDAEGGLRVPSDLDQSICSYEALSAPNREKFDRAAFWFGTASGMRDISVSASFAAFVSAIESLTARGTAHDFKSCPVCGRPGKHEVQGRTKLFRSFLATYAPDASLAKDRNRMYDLRSTILHGSDLMEIDQIVPIKGWTPTGFKEDELYNGIWRVTRTALRNWLKSPPPQSAYLQQAREVCAYFHWSERGRPLWENNVDWVQAEEEIPDQ